MLQAVQASADIPGRVPENQDIYGAYLDEVPGGLKLEVQHLNPR
jgi:hypothetical protein